MSLRTKINAGFIAAATFLAIISAISYRNTNLMIDNSKLVAHTHEVIATIDLILSEFKDLESSQRGFAITGQEGYLDTYRESSVLLDSGMLQLKSLTSDNSVQQKSLVTFQELRDQRAQLLEQGIELRRSRGQQAALDLITTNNGLAIMNQIRAIAAEMKREENRLLRIRDSKTNESTSATMTVLVFGGVLSILIIMGAAVFVNVAETERVRTNQNVESQNRIRAGLIRLNEKVVGDLSVSTLAKNVVDTISEFVEAKVGALYLADENGTLHWSGGFAYQPDEKNKRAIKPGDGLIGQVALTRTPMSLRDIPDNYLKIHSALGETKPNAIEVVPILQAGQVKGVFELGSLNEFSDENREFLRLSADIIGVAINSAQARLKIRELLEETQTQAEELQQQQEELRSTNEELQTKSDDLEAQQEELRVTNEELTQQKDLLEDQKEILDRKNEQLERAQGDLQTRAEEIDRVSRYKSEFLANMSHELRTPLNSQLILSKLLVENKEKNLTPKQTEFARTIQATGLDLLQLINDILDLSKVEAGKLELEVKDVEIKDIVVNLERDFRQIIEQKGLAFKVEVDAKKVSAIRTDSHRLGQVLKNLLSNASKFTETGSITLRVSPVPSDKEHPQSRVAFQVVDTGIGIPADKLESIFNAFEQVDSSTSRRYGGTGLGLAISKNLVALLGGDLQVKSKVGEGSVFTLLLPEKLEVAKSSATPPSFAKPTVIASAPPTLKGAEKVLLIVEDDTSFTKVLKELAERKGFTCLTATDGPQGLNLAREYKPLGILLDYRLPGMDGLQVLNELKRHPETQNIPVHMMSVDDHSHKAREMGAVDYLVKPVTAESISASLTRLEENANKKIHKVLVVEDENIQREEILRLLVDKSIACKGVSLAKDAIDTLKSDSSYDCMILDLALPDMSGFALIKAIQALNIPAPHIIVHTARDLSRKEEEQLRRDSDSIIIKGGKSHERLLDEVSLFIHRVIASVSSLSPVHENTDAYSPDKIFAGKKILLVDDDIRNVFSLTSVLEDKHVKVVIARNGAEALQSLRENPDTSLVLMDVMMPVMDGLEATRQIRKIEAFKKLPVITLTAKAMKEDKEACFAAGASDYLSKPIDVDRLVTLLRVWLSK